MTVESEDIFVLLDSAVGLMCISNQTQKLIVWLDSLRLAVSVCLASPSISQHNFLSSVISSQLLGDLPWIPPPILVTPSVSDTSTTLQGFRDPGFGTALGQHYVISHMGRQQFQLLLLCLNHHIFSTQPSMLAFDICGVVAVSSTCRRILLLLTAFEICELLKQVYRKMDTCSKNLWGSFMS